MVRGERRSEEEEVDVVGEAFIKKRPVGKLAAIQDPEKVGTTSTFDKMPQIRQGIELGSDSIRLTPSHVFGLTPWA